jgi:DNA-binding NarL/FixJ family response regulator
MSQTIAPPIRILVVDDHAIVREGVRKLIERHGGWEVCGEANSGRDGVKLAEELRPDIVVLDIGIDELNGVDATRQIKRRSPETEILLFTGNRNETLVKAGFDAGARSYILKTEITSHLVAALEALSVHKAYFTPDIAEIVFKRFVCEGTKPEDRGRIGELSERELETVQLLVEGRSNKEVAAKLGISVKTVESHRAAIMRKLRLDSFSELVRWAIRNKIIEA